MAGGDKRAINRTRLKVRIINFAESIVEGFVFVAFNQRLSDLLNDDRAFLPIETEAGELRVIAKRAIMEVELLETGAARKPASGDRVTPLVAGNAFDILGATADADDAEVRVAYLARKASVDPALIAKICDNPDLVRAATELERRYDAAFDSIANSRKIDAIAAAIREAQPKRRRFNEA
jgi:hypothetical protein